VDDQFDAALRELEDGPDDDAARLRIAQEYAYVVPDARSLTALAGLGRLVEIGAGTGYWAYRLQAMGVDVIALDHAPPDSDTPNRYHEPTPTWTDVLRGDITALRDHTTRALFLCWPPLYSNLGGALSFYIGDTVAYIGDGGYRTARIRMLNETFSKVSDVPVRALEPHPEVAPRLTIWRRRRLTLDTREG
jgi:hypothetical protein